MHELIELWLAGNSLVTWKLMLASIDLGLGAAS